MLHKLNNMRVIIILLIFLVTSCAPAKVDTCTYVLEMQKMTGEWITETHHLPCGSKFFIYEKGLAVTYPTGDELFPEQWGYVRYHIIDYKLK